MKGERLVVRVESIDSMRYKLRVEEIEQKSWEIEQLIAVSVPSQRV